ncbi:MAG: substrate-binding domain-containing protein [Alphaproteobacteria bacterium]|nr:substrate-binding domain-containing protein [Alphaproteobacteria bacterium]
MRRGPHNLRRIWLDPLCMVLCMIAGLGLAQAAEVRLQIKGGGFEITGELQEFDGQTYVIESEAFGRMRLDGERFECLGAACPSVAALRRGANLGQGETIRNLGETSWMGGSGIGTNFMPELIKSYAAANDLSVKQAIGTDTRDLIFTLNDDDGNSVGTFNVLRRGVSLGYRELIAGNVDLVWTSARMSDAQQRLFSQAGAGPMRVQGNEHVFALDAMVVLVAKDNPAASISLEDLAGIYSGQITDWAQLGLPAGKINVYAPVEGMGLLMHFKNTILAPSGLRLTEDAKRLGTVVEWSDKVASDRYGISFNFIGYIRNAKALNISSPCGLISRPSYFSAKTEEFPLSRRLYFYTRGTPSSPLARELLTYALSPKIQSALKASNFVDQEPETQSFDEQRARIVHALNAPDDDFDMVDMRALMSDLAQAERFTTTLHFENSSSRLDPKAKDDIRRLASVLKGRKYAGREVLLIGFADTIGGYAINRQLSENRARAVALELRAAGYEGAVTKGYSELAPVVCNDTPENRNFNRRVEVWIR